MIDYEPEVARIRSLIGREVGPGAWRTLGIADRDKFLELCGGDEWSYGDPGGSTDGRLKSGMVGGDLTLVIAASLRHELLDLAGFEVVVNYGWNKIDYLGGITIPASIRCRAKVLSVRGVDARWHELVTCLGLEAEGVDGNFFVGDSVTRVLASASGQRDEE
jgi:acyl dehydratase